MVGVVPRNRGGQTGGGQTRHFRGRRCRRGCVVPGWRAPTPLPPHQGGRGAGCRSRIFAVSAAPGAGRGAALPELGPAPPQDSPGYTAWWYAYMDRYHPQQARRCAGFPLCSRRGTPCRRCRRSSPPLRAARRPRDMRQPSTVKRKMPARKGGRERRVCLAMKEKEVEGSPVLRGIVDLRIVDLDPKNPSSYLPSRLVH